MGRAPGLVGAVPASLWSALAVWVGPRAGERLALSDRPQAGKPPLGVPVGSLRTQPRRQRPQRPGPGKGGLPCVAAHTGESLSISCLEAVPGGASEGPMSPVILGVGCVQDPRAGAGWSVLLFRGLCVPQAASG